MKKIFWALILVVLFLAPSALGLSITKTGTELASGTFSNTSVSADAVVLGTTGRTLWPGIDGSGVLVKSVTTDADGVALAGDGAGGTFVVWRQWRPASSDYILLAGYVSPSGGLNWITGEVVTTTIEANDRPRMIKSTKGGVADGAIAVWSRSSSIVGTKVNTGQTAIWNNSRICTAEGMQDEPNLVSDDNGGTVIAWRDNRFPATGTRIYAQRLNEYGSMESGWQNNGVLVTNAISNPPYSDPKIIRLGTDYLIAYEGDGANGNLLHTQKISAAGVREFDLEKDISAKNDNKYNWTIQPMVSPYSGAIVVFDNGPSDSERDVYAQQLDSSGVRQWGTDGVTLDVRSGAQWYPGTACLPDGKSMFSWLDSSGSTYEAHLQKLDVSGAAEWGKILTEEVIARLAADGAGGAYASGISVSYVPRVYRIDGSGNLLWGNSGILVSASSIYSYRTGEALPILASDDNDGMIIAWAEKSGSNTNVYVQKASTRYFAGGVYTGEQVQNTDTRFGGWGSITWESTDTLTAEARTAASLSALSSASWSPATNGGSIPSNGPFIQSRFYFASNSGGTSTQTLRSYSLNYSIDTAFPTIESVKADTVTLSASTTTDIAPAPTIEATLTDDYKISSADIKVDDVSVSHSFVSSAETRWVIRSTVATPLSTGSHTIKVNVIDSSGNSTNNTYNVSVASQPAVKSGSIAGFSEGSKVTLAYELTLPADVTIEIRDLTGTLVKKFVVPGGGVGSNSVSVDREALGKGAYIVIITPAGGSPTVGNAVF